MPFMTVGDQVLKKALDIEDINRILKHCPKLNVAPNGCINYLKKACKGRNFTQEAMRIIIDGMIDTHSG